MAEPALIDALRRKADADVEEIWRKARADADAWRADRARAVDEHNVEATRAGSAAARELHRAATADAQREARRIRAAAKAALAARLHRIAVDSLARFRTDGYDDVFSALARELPTRDWQRVIVNPADRDRAQRQFPNAQVVCDPAIVGGMAVDTEGGRVRIDNTLETRLDTGWPEMLPGVMSDVFAELAGL